MPSGALLVPVALVHAEEARLEALHELADANGLGTESDELAPLARGNVVVVEVEPAAGDARGRGERVQFLERGVAHYVRP